MWRSLACFGVVVASCVWSVACVEPGAIGAPVERPAPKLSVVAPTGWIGEAAVLFRCRAEEAEAAELNDVSVTYKSTDGVDVNVALVSADGEYWEKSVLLSDGSYTAQCIASYGWQGEETAFSPVSSFGVDTVAPVVTLEQGGWIAGEAVVSLTAMVEDGGELSSAEIQFQRIAFAGEKSDGGKRWSFRFPAAKVISPGSEGAESFTVIVRDAANHVGVAEGHLKIDPTPPIIRFEPIEEWHGVSSSMNLVVKVTDQESGVADGGVSLSLGTRQWNGVREGDDRWVFDIPFATALSPDSEGEFEYTVHAKDRVGNESVVKSLIRVDGRPPIVATRGPQWTQWHGEEEFDVELMLTASGAPVVKATLESLDGLVFAEGVLSGSLATFTVAPKRWQSPGEEGDVQWQATVWDAADNRAILKGAFRVDRKPPKVSLNSPNDWFGSQSVEVTATVEDLGSGVSDSVLVGVGAEWRACRKTLAAWACDVDTTSIARGKSGVVSYRIVSDDLAGNRGERVGELLVDKMPPTATFVNDGKWYGRNASVLVKANVSDAESGVHGGNFILKITKPRPSQHVGILDGSQDGKSGVVSFAVPASVVVEAGGTTGAVIASLVAQDRLGNESILEKVGLFNVDDTPPGITLTSMTYGGSPGLAYALPRDPFGERAKVRVVLSVVDDGSGVKSVQMKQAERTFPASSVSGSQYVFDIDLATFSGLVGSGTIDFQVTATDNLGLAAVRNISVRYDRTLWSYNTGKGISHALALNDARVFATVTSAVAPNVLGFERASGELTFKGVTQGVPTTAPLLGGGTGELLMVASSGLGGMLGVMRANQSGDVSLGAYQEEIGEASGALAYASYPAKPGGSDTSYVYHASSKGAFTTNLMGCATFLGASFCTALKETTTPLLPSFTPSSGPIAHGRYAFVGGSGGQTMQFSRSAPTQDGVTWTAQRLSMARSPSQSIRGVAGRAGGAIFMQPGVLLELTTATPSTESQQSVGYSGSATPIVVGKSASYFGTSSGELWQVGRFSATKLTVPGAIDAPPLLGQYANGSETLYYVAGSTLYELKAGANIPVWSLSLGASVRGSPVLDCSGILYVATTNGVVRAIVTDSARLSTSEWPKFQHDNRNTGNFDFEKSRQTPCVH